VATGGQIQTKLVSTTFADAADDAPAHNCRCAHIIAWPALSYLVRYGLLLVVLLTWMVCGSSDSQLLNEI
jgi:hypothetical protein